MRGFQSTLEIIRNDLLLLLLLLLSLLFNFLLLLLNRFLLHLFRSRKKFHLNLLIRCEMYIWKLIIFSAFFPLLCLLVWCFCHIYEYSSRCCFYSCVKCSHRKYVEILLFTMQRAAENGLHSIDLINSVNDRTTYSYILFSCPCELIWFFISSLAALLRMLQFFSILFLAWAIQLIGEKKSIYRFIYVNLLFNFLSLSRSLRVSMLLQFQ